MSDSSGKGWLARTLALFASGKPEPETWHDRLPEEGLSEADELMVETLPFERLTVSGNEAMDAWTRHREQGRAYPVIVGDDESLARVAENWSFDDRSPEEIIGLADGLVHPAGLVAHRQAQDEAAREYLEKAGEDVDEDYVAPVGDWPEEADASPGPTVVRDIRTGDPLERVHLLLVPTQDGANVPAHLRWGNWNEVPPAEYHVAALRSWRERYGAELVVLTGDVMELRVQRRPSTRDEALELAREHYAFCADIVDQGTEDLATLAAVLMVSDWWYFWWD